MCHASAGTPRHLPHAGVHPSHLYPAHSLAAASSLPNIWQLRPALCRCLCQGGGGLYHCKGWLLQCKASSMHSAPNPEPHLNSTTRSLAELCAFIPCPVAAARQLHPTMTARRGRDAPIHLTTLQLLPPLSPSGSRRARPAAMPLPLPHSMLLGRLGSRLGCAPLTKPFGRLGCMSTPTTGPT